MRSPRSIACSRYTLTEVLVAASLGTILIAGFMSFISMASVKLKTGQAQIMFNQKGRYGAEWITRRVESGRMVLSEADGLTAYIANVDNTLSVLTYEDADGNANTIRDNAIWYQPNSLSTTDKRILLPYVSKLGTTPLFATLNGSLWVRCHIGDTAPVSQSDGLSGPGYQGLQIRFVATPRNLGQIWTGGGFE